VPELAGLPRVQEAAEQGGVDGGLDIGVVEHDHR